MWKKTPPFPPPVTEVRLEEPPAGGSYISTIEVEVAAMYLCYGLPLIKLMSGYLSGEPCCIMMFKGERALDIREAQWKNLLPEPASYKRVKAELEKLVEADFRRGGIYLDTEGGMKWKRSAARTLLEVVLG